MRNLRMSSLVFESPLNFMKIGETCFTDEKMEKTQGEREMFFATLAFLVRSRDSYAKRAA